MIKTEKVLPENGYMRINDVLRVIPVGRSSWYKGMADGFYPKPVKLSARAVAWRVKDIKALIERIEATSEENN